MIDIYYSCCFGFVSGTILGSFINMLVYRMHNSQSILGRSYCDYTKKKLKLVDLIPIVSFILFKGKCRECGKKIPLLYPAIELITGLSFALLFSKMLTLELNIFGLIVGLIFFFLLIFYAADDYLHWELDGKILLLGIVSGVVINVLYIILSFQHMQLGFENILAGIAGGVFIWAVIRLTEGGGMGEGDIYLFAVCGLFLGLKGLILAFFIASCTGSVVGLAKAIKNNKFRGTKIQLAPFVAFGAIVSFLYQDAFWAFMVNQLG